MERARPFQTLAAWEMTRDGQRVQNGLREIQVGVPRVRTKF